MFHSRMKRNCDKTHSTYSANNNFSVIYYLKKILVLTDGAYRVKIHQPKEE